MKNLSLNLILSLLLMAFIFSACSAARELTEGGPADPESTDEVLATEEARALQQLLDETRSTLADVEESDQLEVPSHFAQEASSNSAVSGNPYQGFRIQLISTRSVEEADTLSNQFLEWIESEALGYRPEAYVFFKQPYYRVHVGDFQSKARAADFTKLVKQKYPDAWVVPDRIVPANVPPEDVTFSTEEDTTETLEKLESEN